MTRGTTPEHTEVPTWLRMPHRRVLLCAGLVALAMLVVGFLLSVLGIAALKLSGGAAHDTSLVVFVAAFVVTDFWGGGIVSSLTRRSADEVTVAWGIARAVLLVAMALVSSKLFYVVPIQLLLALPAAWLGVHVATKQAALRRAAQQERAAIEAARKAAAAAREDRPARTARV